jgi:hypothetical protein
MEIKFCPECGDEVVYLALAMWPGIDEPVRVAECVSVDCGWAGVDEEYEEAVLRVSASSAA